jgi:hypothetical protein
MENRDRFADHEIIAEVATGDAAFPEAVLAKVTNPAALGAEHSCVSGHSEVEALQLRRP